MDTYKCCSHGRVQLTAPCRIWTQILSSDWQDMAQYWYIAASYTDGLDTALFCCWTKHCHISLPLWQLLKIKQTLKFFAEGDFNRRKKSRDHGLLKLNIHSAEQSTNLLCETRIWLPHSAYRTPNTCRHWNMNYRLKTNKMIQLWISSLSCI